MRRHLIVPAPYLIITVAWYITISPVTSAESAFFGPPCGPGNGGCYFPNSTPGCENAACCTAVCEIDSFCCDFAWDLTCAELAADVCGDCGDENAGDCFAANGTRGCDNVECCIAVCNIDPFCCDVGWDADCAALAATTCVGCGGANSGSCFVANGSPACEDGDCCETVCAIEPYCCDTGWDEACAALALDLCAGCGSTAAGNCVLSNGNAGCEDGDCCALICALDEFCCGDSWDSICAALAIENCTVCGAIPAGNPFAANNTPNSWNLDCCNAVCAIDPFCCETAWDADCAALALTTCALPCEGDVPFTTPGTVNVSDLLALLDAWGPASPFETADIDPFPGGNGTVNVSDLLFLLANWGPCP